TVRIDVIGDTIIELDETFSVTLSNPGGGAVIGRQTGTATIRNDDANKLSVSNASVIEGDAGTSALVFTVSLAEPANQPVTVVVNTADGTATAADHDYAPIRGLVLTFLPGDPLSQTVTVAVNGDTTIEADETLTLTLSD